MTEQMLNQTFNAAVGSVINGNNNHLNVSQSIGFSNVKSDVTDVYVKETKLQIQQILNNLLQNQPTANLKYIESELDKKIKHNPTLKDRLISAFKAGGIEALKTIFNHPAVSIPVETIKGFIES